MRVLVVGAGAIGGLCASTLRAAGADVRVVSRRGGRILDMPVLTWDDVPAAAARGVDAALVCVKAYATADVAERLQRLDLSPGTCVVSLQNGLGNEEALAAVASDWVVVAGAVTAAVHRDRGGDSRATRGGVALSAWSAAVPPPAAGVLDALAERFTRGGLPARVIPGSRGRDLKWSKLLLNVAANGTAAALGWTPARIARDPLAMSFEIGLLRETVRVGEAAGVRWVDVPGFPVRLFRHVLRGPAFLVRRLLARPLAGARGDKPPSLLLDLEAGRPLEAPWLYGRVAEAAEEAGLGAPFHRTVLRALEARRNGAPPWSPDRLWEGVRREDGRSRS
ncbi:MAG: ketopantoate reductase family protein [Clostridia bacterium]|nr:ketopantoate reductase family protein [Clostridia bacterium]